MTGRALVVTMAVVACAWGTAWGTDVVNNITENTTWTQAGSPYVIVRSPVVEVKSNATLTIEPGVTVKFQPGRALEVIAGSSIVAVGTAGGNIVFTSNSLSPAVGDWLHVGVSGSSGSAFSYCVFEYAQQGLSLSLSSPDVEFCTFHACQIGLQLVRSSPAVTTCAIMDCTSAGIQCQYRETTPVIHDCSISNPGANIYNIYLLNYLSPLAYIDATQNWWGTDVESEIVAKIYDRFDSGSIFGEVGYADYLHAPGVEPSSWGSIKALFKP